MTKIEWTHRPRTKGESWNPITGCTKISPGCENCYAERMSKRLAGRFGYSQDEPFKVTLHPDKLELPLKWRKPRTVFVVSMGDLFHKDVPNGYLDSVFHTMSAPQMYHPHTYLVLTKRPKRMYEYISEAWPNLGTIYPHIWLGVTCEDQKRADERIPWLLRTPTKIRFVSDEPMLGPITFDFESDTCHCGEFHKGHIFETHEFVPLLESYLFGIDWVICGGETGPGAREMNPDWARDIRDQCKATDTPFFMKQMSNRAPIPNDLLIREWPEIHP